MDLLMTRKFNGVQLDCYKADNKRYGRDYILIDKSRKYCDMAEERLMEMRK